MCKRLCNFLELHHILMTFSLRLGNTTALALMKVLDNIYEYLDKRKSADCNLAFFTNLQDVWQYNQNLLGVTLTDEKSGKFPPKPVTKGTR